MLNRRRPSSPVFLEFNLPWRAIVVTAVIASTNVMLCYFFFVQSFGRPFITWRHVSASKSDEREDRNAPRMKLYCATSPFRIFFGSVLSPLSTSAYSPSSANLPAISAAYSFCIAKGEGRRASERKKTRTHAHTQRIEKKLLGQENAGEDGETPLT